MFLRCTRRIKDGKEHRYWSIVESRRGASRRVVQRQVLYLGEINDSQKAAWCRCIEVFEGPQGEGRQVVLFPEDRAAPELAHEVVHVRLQELQVERPRQWGRLLVVRRIVATTETGRLLEGAAGREPRGDRLARRAENAGELSVDRSWQRVALAPGMV